MTNNNHSTIWDNCLSYIKENINDRKFKTWFEPIKPIKLEDDILTIQVPNKFFYEWLEEHYIGLLRTCILKELGKKGRLEYLILIDNKNQFSGSNEAENKVLESKDIKNPFVIPGIKKVKIDSNLNAKYTFDKFIEGDSNRLARSAGKAIAKAPGATAFNPLFVYGGVGIGKTHLAHAIGNEIKAQFPSNNVLYITTDRFTNQIINAIKKNTIDDLIGYYQHVDTLILDDVQFLAGRAKTQEILFNLFNRLHQNGKQIILTSDRAPIDLEKMEDRLISRFKWGLSADIQAPRYETRMAIVQDKLEEELDQIPEEVLEYVCHNVVNNIRELEGVMISLIAQSTLNLKDIDVSLAREIINKYVVSSNKEVALEKIKKLVADHFKVSVEKMQSSTRKREVVIARQLSMYLAKHFTNKSLKSIGDDFGGKDHSTVIYSLRAVKDMMDTDEGFKNQVNEIERKVQMSIGSGY